jgi:response regulator RpfG family c-di-GMP phosphodiesterase
MSTSSSNRPISPSVDRGQGERILCVDDEPKLLAVYQRMFEGQFAIDIAEGPEKGLAAVAERGPFAVVVSDMRMPGMNGAQFLGRVRVISPESVRMLLTGYADQQSAIDAINEGSVFRFLTKPCSKDVFGNALAAAIEQHRLIVSEKELLEGTLRGSIQVLTELLALVNPLAFGRTERVKRTMLHLAGMLQAEKPWQFEVAALLSQLGCIALSEGTLRKMTQGAQLTPQEQAHMDAHPMIAANLIRKIPRLSEVAEMISQQDQRFLMDSADESTAMRDIPLGARSLKAALDYDNLVANGKTHVGAISVMYARQGWYDPVVLAALEKMPQDWAGYTEDALSVAAVRPRMILNEDLQMPNGLVLARKGFELTEIALMRLEEHFNYGNIKGLIKVLVPPATPN